MNAAYRLYPVNTPTGWFVAEQTGPGDNDDEIVYGPFATEAEAEANIQAIVEDEAAEERCRAEEAAEEAFAARRARHRTAA